MRSLREITDAFHTGSVSREEYWHQMQARHLKLREYQALITGTEVTSISIHPEELRIVTGGNVAMAWQPEDVRSAPNVLVNYGSYEPEDGGALLDAGNGAEVIFDVGANAGYYSLHWISRIAPSGVIHAFEPVPSTFARLARNIAINGFGDKIVANNFGLSDEPGVLRMFLPALSGSGAASIKNQHSDEDTVEVEARIDTLDNYFKTSGLKRIDLMKVDVEGAELLVLKGGQATLVATKPLLFMELLRKWSKAFGYHPNDVITLLAGLGYRCYAFDAGKLAPFTTMTDETVQTNFFFADPAKHTAWLRRNGLT